jgi:hypothetical protein
MIDECTRELHIDLNLSAAASRLISLWAQCRASFSVMKPPRRDRSSPSKVTIISTFPLDLKAVDLQPP